MSALALRLWAVQMTSAFMKYLVVDEADGKYVLRPRRTSQRGWTYLSDRQTFDREPCVFLHQLRGRSSTAKCSVHPAKPDVGAAHECWNNKLKPPGAYWERDDLVALGWDGDLKR